MIPGQNYGLMSAPQAQPMAMGAMAPPQPAPGPSMGAMGPSDSTAQMIIAHLLQQGLQMPQGQPGQPVMQPGQGSAGQPPLSLTPQMIQQIMQQRAMQAQPPQAQPQMPQGGQMPGAGLGDIQQAQRLMGVGGR